MTDPEIRAASARFLAALRGHTDMTEAETWHRVCLTRTDAATVIRDDFCIRQLHGAAASVTPCGRDGHMWTFSDQSRLTANGEGAWAG